MPAISKEVFCKALTLINEQRAINEEFSKSLQTVGNGHFAFGTENKYMEALLMVLKEAMCDKYDYIEWWLYEATEKTVYTPDNHAWDLTESKDLYEFILMESQK